MAAELDQLAGPQVGQAGQAQADAPQLDGQGHGGVGQRRVELGRGELGLGVHGAVLPGAGLGLGLASHRAGQDQAAGAGLRRRLGGEPATAGIVARRQADRAGGAGHGPPHWRAVDRQHRAGPQPHEPAAQGDRPRLGHPLAGQGAVPQQGGQPHRQRPGQGRGRQPAVDHRLRQPEPDRPGDGPDPGRPAQRHQGPEALRQEGVGADAVQDEVPVAERAGLFGQAGEGPRQYISGDPPLHRRDLQVFLAGQPLIAQQAVDQGVRQRRLDAQPEPGRQPGPGEVRDDPRPPQARAAPLELGHTQGQGRPERLAQPGQGLAQRDLDRRPRQPSFHLGLAAGQLRQRAERAGLVVGVGGRERLSGVGAHARPPPLPSGYPSAWSRSWAARRTRASQSNSASGAMPWTFARIRALVNLATS